MGEGRREGTEKPGQSRRETLTEWSAAENRRDRVFRHPSRAWGWGALPKNAAGDATTAAAERQGLIGVVVVAGMDHQRATLQPVEVGDPGCRQPLLGRAVRGDVERRQVAEMAAALGPPVLPRPFRVPVAAGRTARDDQARIVR